MFGYSVCIHNNTIIVGAYGDSSSGSNTGAVYVFRKTANEFDPVGASDGASNATGTKLMYKWVEIQKLAPGEMVECRALRLYHSYDCSLAWH
jgi:hypothetical protein